MTKKTCVIPPSESKIFEEKVKELKASGKYRGVFDATKKLQISITAKSIKEAVMKDENSCVIANGCRESLDEETYLSIGDRIAKILYYERGKVVRYELPPRLRKAVKEFDNSEGTVWILEPGMYTLCVPCGNMKLVSNQSEKDRKEGRNRWDKFTQSFEKNGATGEGINKFQGRSLRTRQVTLLRG